MTNATRAIGAALPLQAGEHAASVTLAASPDEASRARRWLDDLTAGAIEHELDTEQAIAAVNALYPGGWPAFVGPAGPVQCNRWFDDEPPDPAACSDCGIETLDWWVDADELIHCDNAEACRARQVAVVLAASPAEAERARRWLDDLTAGALEVHLDEYELVAVVNLLHPAGWYGFLTDETAGARPWLDDEDDDQ